MKLGRKNAKFESQIEFKQYIITEFSKGLAETKVEDDKLVLNVINNTEEIKLNSLEVFAITTMIGVLNKMKTWKSLKTFYSSFSDSKFNKIQYSRK